MVTPFDEGDIEAIEVTELLARPGGESIFLKLLHNQFFQHLRARGLQVERDRRRAYFARGEERERRLSYQGRLRKATRTVVKARMRRDGSNVLYYEHKAASFSVMRFGADWAVILTPGYAFTETACASQSVVSAPIRSQPAEPLAISIRRCFRMYRSGSRYSPAKPRDCSRWRATPQMIWPLRADDPAVASGSTISFNVSAFEETAQLESEVDEDLRRLEAELEELALEPDDEEPSNRDEDAGQELEDGKDGLVVDDDD